MIFCLVVVKIRCNIEAPDVALLALKKMSTKNGPVLDIIPLRFMLQIFHTNDNLFKVIILTFSTRNILHFGPYHLLDKN